MREIKYRAWDKINRCMDYDLFLGLDGALYTCAEKTYDTPNMEIEKVNDNDFVLMQFTGLHDKNGKEIYEGDIVPADEYYFYDATGIIKWCKDTARFIIDFGNKCIIWDFDDTYSYKLEVIGNIFDNPELLKK